jgi:ketosteroid isomerase-like protein
MLHALTTPVLLLLLAAAPEIDLTTQAEQVRCAETAFSESVENGDWEAFETIVHADARFASGSRPSQVGAPAIRAGWERSYSRPERAIRWRSRSVEILKPGALALSRGPYRMQVTAEDGEMTETWGTFNSIWVHEGERWQVIFDLGSEGVEEGDEELIASGGAACPG